MAYYFSKQSVLEEFEKSFTAIAEKGWRLFIDPAEPAKNLANGNDFVSLLWSESKKEDEKQVMGMRVFFKIDEELYTDDQFAADQYMAAKKGKTVRDIVMMNKKFLEQ